MCLKNSGLPLARPLFSLEENAWNIWSPAKTGPSPSRRGCGGSGRKRRRCCAASPPRRVTLFVVSVICMNLLANKTLVQTEWLALDGGILVSWLSFLCMDVITKHFGPRASNRVAVLAAGVNLLTCLIFYIASIIPSNAADYTALNGILGGTWFILLGSTVAFLASAALNNFLNWAIGSAFRKNSGRPGRLCRAHLYLHLHRPVRGQLPLFRHRLHALRAHLLGRLPLDALAVRHVRADRRGGRGADGDRLLALRLPGGAGGGRPWAWAGNTSNPPGGTANERHCSPARPAASAAPSRGAFWTGATT